MDFEAIIQLVRRGSHVRAAATPFRQATRPLGLRTDVSNVAEALELLDGPGAR